MRKAVFFLFLVVIVLASCEIDAYDKGEGSYSLLTADMAEVYVGADRYATYADLDDGTHLTLEPRATANWIQKGDTVYRALLYYNKVDGTKAKPVNISRVGILMPLDSLPKPTASGRAGVTADEGLKTDPLHLESVWMSKSRRYLNLRLRLLTGTAEDDAARHILGLLADSIAPQHQRLRLHHDRGVMPEYYSSVVFTSIPLSAVKADTLTLVVNTYDGSVSRTFAVR